MYREEDIICRAKIECRIKKFPIKIFLICLFIIYTLSYFSTVHVIFSFGSCNFFNSIRPIFGKNEYVYTTDLYREYLFVLQIPVMYKENGKSVIMLSGIILLIFSITFVIGFPIIVSYIKRKNAERCSLCLTKDCIYGCSKTLLHEKTFNITNENVDDIFYYSGITDHFKPHKRICILYDDGKIIEFKNVYNAEEFVSKYWGNIDVRMNLV